MHLLRRDVKNLRLGVESGRSQYQPARRSATRPGCPVHAARGPAARWSAARRWREGRPLSRAVASGFTSRASLDQAIGDARHGRDDDDQLVPRLVRFGDAAGDIADALGITDRRSAKFLDKEGHGERPRYRQEILTMAIVEGAELLGRGSVRVGQRNRHRGVEKVLLGTKIVVARPDKESPSSLPAGRGAEGVLERSSRVPCR